MADIAGQVAIDVRSDAARVAREFNKLDKSLMGSVRSGAKAEKGFLSLNKVLTAGAVILASRKIIDLGKASVQAASDFEETASKFETVFRSVGDEAELAAGRLEDSYGLSIQTSRDLLSATGDLLTGFGLSGSAALELAENTNKLAVDLASFTNYAGGAEGASAALTKALLGERESIKSLGIAITETDLKDFAEGQGKVYKELTRQEKAVLTLELAYKQSTNAIGDFERTSGSLANQQRQLSENMENLAIQLGNSLLPLTTRITSNLVEFTESTGGAASSIDKLIEAFTLLGSTISLTFAPLDAAKAGIQELGEAAGRLWGNLKIGAENSTGFLDYLKKVPKSVKEAFSDSGTYIEEFKEKYDEKIKTVAQDSANFFETEGAIEKATEAGENLGAAVASGIETGLEDTGDAAKEAAEKMQDEFNNIGESVVDGLLSPLKDGENAFDRLKNVASNVLGDLSRQLLKVGLFGGSVGGGAETTGLLGGLFGAAKGGIVPKASKFAGSFASGGLIGKGDDQLASVASKEMVLTEGQQANLFNMANGKGNGSSSTNINVYNTGVDTSVETRPNGDIDIFNKRTAAFIGSAESDEALNSSDFRRGSTGIQGA